VAPAAAAEQSAVSQGEPVSFICAT
jgi:hypothetical protein